MRYILFFFFAFMLVTIYAQPVKPLLHLIKGETYFMSSSGTSVMTQNIHGRENKLTLALSFTMAFKVVNVRDTVYEMEACYQSIYMKIHTKDTSIEMDSAPKAITIEKKKQPDTASLLIAAMVNKPFGIALTVKGKVLWVKNLDKIIADAFNDFRLTDTAKKAQVQNQFKQSFGENAFKGTLEMGIAIFPKTMVAKNNVWSVNSNLSAPARANVKTVYQLTDITATYFQVHGEGTITTDDDAKPGVINGMPAKYNLNGGSMVDIKLDRKTGWINRISIKQLIEGEIDILDNPKMPGGTTIPMMFNTDVNIH
ncbi:DUF6263 family protein [Mucilaginibacter sp.]|uniref:DUF6263 family protein n=1 Tax=Mucilaginibacter sp. TaxID=1882438 RepID=UPI0028411A51|nr:DUF6263 family protein [Mucilaginibacter sp.]MDR3695382.1 DUF6263 family protein [Mucilaginibacter sp.]